VLGDEFLAGDCLLLLAALDLDVVDDVVECQFHLIVD
jgi:hypothetical protein